MNKNVLGEDTIIEIGKSIPLSKFRAFFEAATGKELPGCEFQPWLNTQAGKTLQEAAAAYSQAAERKSLGEILLENRFTFISDSDKAFINAFNQEIENFGYDFSRSVYTLSLKLTSFSSCY